MEVFRITLSQYADTLYASGRSNRWNIEGEKVIYTAGSRSLACLENIVHSSGQALQQQFSVSVIYLPDNSSIEIIKLEDLPKDWNERIRPRTCQQIGRKWLHNQSSLILQVPSAIIPDEKNFVINPAQKEFRKVKIIDIQEFNVDKRLQ